MLKKLIQKNLDAMLDFTEAIKDSPSFRHDIILNERHFDKVQKKLEDVIFE